MIVRFSPDAPPRLTDAGRLDRLHAVVDGGVDGGVDRTAGEPDDDHVWIDVAWLREAGLAQADDPDYASRFDAMIGYAATKGWLDEAGDHVRAHIEPE